MLDRFLSTWHKRKSLGKKELQLEKLTPSDFCPSGVFLITNYMRGPSSLLQVPLPCSATMDKNPWLHKKASWASKLWEPGSSPLISMASVSVPDSKLLPGASVLASLDNRLCWGRISQINPFLPEPSLVTVFTAATVSKLGQGYCYEFKKKKMGYSYWTKKAGS